MGNKKSGGQEAMTVRPPVINLTSSNQSQPRDGWPGCRTPFPPENSATANAPPSSVTSADRDDSRDHVTHQPADFLQQDELTEILCSTRKVQKAVWNPQHCKLDSTRRRPAGLCQHRCQRRHRKWPGGHSVQPHPQRTGPTWRVTLRSSWLSVPFLPHPFL